MSLTVKTDDVGRKDVDPRAVNDVGRKDVDPRASGANGLKRLSTLGAREPVTGYRHEMVLRSHFEYSICN